MPSPCPLGYGANVGLARGTVSQAHAILPVCSMRLDTCQVLMQNVLRASQGNAAVAAAWLADMAPFIHGEPESAKIVMYADEADSLSAAARCATVSDAGTGAQENVYWEHRAVAVKHTRSWRRLFRQCAFPPWPPGDAGQRVC